MTILVTADLHLNDNPRDQYRHDFLIKYLPAMVQKYHAEELYILGDLTDEKDRHGAQLVNSLVDQLTNLTQFCHIVILRGNHDYVVPNHPFYGFLKNIHRIAWVNEPRIEEGNFVFLPHTTNYQRDWQSLDFLGKTIFAHNTFEGADVGNRRLEGIPTDIFPQGTKVYSGDIHVPQRFGSITYVGAPYLVDFGDSYEPRVLVLDGKKVISVKCPGPQKRLVEIERMGNDALLQVQVQGNLKAGDILKVRVKVNSADYAHWSEIRDKVRQWGDKQGYVINMVKPVVDQSQQTFKKKLRAGPKSDEQLLNEYAKTRNDIDDRTLKAGMELMREV
jgi:hypothetical protein